MPAPGGERGPRARCRKVTRPLEDGERVGRYVVMHDLDGRLHALAAGAVCALCETDEGALLMLPGGKLVHVARPMAVVLGWLDGRGPG